ncbi:MAG: CHAT domain-containing tetratricopeptide repeat protein [Bacteroidota bacterium]
MKRSIISFFIIILAFSFSTEGQVLKGLGNKLKEKAGSAVKNDNNENVIIKTAIVALKKSYAKKDSTSMNLALSSYDNVAFYSDRKGSENALRYTSTLIGEMGGYEFSREDEGKSTVEMLGVNNPFKKKEKQSRVVNSYSHLTDDQYQLLKQAETLNQTGELSYSSRLYDYAKASFIAASFYLSEEPALENSLLHAKIKSNLGMLFHSVGDFQSSELHFDEALGIMQNAGVQNNYLYAVIANNQAILLKDLGKFNRAEEQLKGVITVFDELGESGKKAALIARNNLAILYQYLGRSQESIKLLETVTKNAEDWGEKSNTYQRVNINLALIYESVGKIAEAEKIYLDALEIKKKQRRTKQPDYASILTNLSSLYLNSGNTEKDIASMLTEAKEIYSKEYGEEHPTLVTVNSVQIANYLKNQEFEKAEAIATSNYEMTGNIYGAGHPKRNKATVQLAMTEWKNGKSSEATNHYQEALDKNIEYIQNYFPAMSEVEKGKYWQTLQPDFHSYYAFSFAKPNEDRLKKVLAYEVNTKGLLLSTSGKIRKQILESGDKELIKNYNDWKSAKNQLAYYYSVPKEELAKQKINLDSIAGAANEKERWLSANTDAFGNDEKNTNVQEKVGAGEAMVDIVKYFDASSASFQYQALVIKSGSISTVKIGEADLLDKKMVKLYKNSIIYKRPESRSYTSFWEPIEAKVAGSSKIYLVKDGVYNQVSIGSLYDGKNYLADRYDLSVITNPSDIHEIRNTGVKAKNMFLIGAPEFDPQKFKALPGTLAEVNTIEGIASRNNVKTTKFLNRDANEGNFDKSTEAEVLHVATHGFFIDNKSAGNKSSGETLLSSSTLDALMRSGIVLSDEGESKNNEISQSDDGLVTAYEISTLDFPATEIVVLSACETGLGEIKTGEGVYGLQRSFLIAGAKSVIMSLWKVDDSATKEFMISFYNNWLSSGNKHESFNQAKRQLKSKYPEPYYWGAFVLIEG